MRAFFAVLFLWVAAAQAQEYPALYDVTGVASDDVLNIRSGPGVTFEVIDTLAADATGVEVVAENPEGTWLQVSAGERSGWVSASLLIHTGPDWNDGLPSSLACFGTEPFWSFVDDDGTAEFSAPELESGVTYTREAAHVPIGLQPVEFSAVYEGGFLSLTTATLRREACSDGMSDREYGIWILLSRIRADGVEVYSGCCSLIP